MTCFLAHRLRLTGTVASRLAHWLAHRLTCRLACRLNYNDAALAHNRNVVSHKHSLKTCSLISACFMAQLRALLTTACLAAQLRTLLTTAFFSAHLRHCMNVLTSACSLAQLSSSLLDGSSRRSTVYSLVYGLENFLS